ncbi:HTH domain-containing protein (plasmid) [Roseinatronobacter sp. S2]|nr:HTH domain-containing protein [Roseinatronobacter sp. S2]WFE76678.1 HTH domain-containing protein [Roseinatronobacter sp. S2]
MQRSGRLLQLLQTLRERRRAVTAKTLAERFNVSQRTIYRDMETLLELGVPVEGEAGTGFILRPGFFLPSMAFTRDEADAVLLGLRFVLARGDSELAKAAELALLKITDGMGRDDEARMLASGLTVGPSVNNRQTELGLVRRALRDRRKLEIAYRPQGKTPGTRVAGLSRSAILTMRNCSPRGVSNVMIFGISGLIASRTWLCWMKTSPDPATVCWQRIAGSNPTQTSECGFLTFSVKPA